ncbi:2-phospho-L-lactate guanylyltransferase [Streptomyces sp. NPDC005921]|uniref:2-phospho-L-lactate guanylyltransferase n=1 Tax=Streptomyces sp. NPDC005827 TaxID=3157070 RepID=UPI0033C10EBE
MALDWTVVLPVKPFHQAKSRLAPWPGTARQDFARAFFLDTLEAVLRTTGVAQVLVVTHDREAAAQAHARGATAVSDRPSRGLNEAIRIAVSHAETLAPHRPIAVLTADLPALRSTELGDALVSASAHDRTFLADHSGEGTTLLAASRPRWLHPAFEQGSRGRHQLGGALEITDLEAVSVRLDVDTSDDLRLAHRLGVGPHTHAVISSAPPQTALSPHPLSEWNTHELH